MEVFKINNLEFFYPEQSKPTLRGINLTVNSGEFVVICGKSGCGKSTFLRQLKTVLTPHGTAKGEVLFNGKPLLNADEKTQAQKIGFVGQSPDNQIVTDKVWHELAFGLESIGENNSVIRRRVAETSSFFGIEDWYRKNVSELSGGQKQLLNLASVMVMQPEVLILDEPTSQLDPIAATEFLNTLKKLNRELGTTVILSEHRLEEAIPLCDKLCVMESGRIISYGGVTGVCKELKKTNNEIFYSMPSTVRIWNSVNDLSHNCPVTIADGRKWLSAYSANIDLKEIPTELPAVRQNETVINVQDVSFKYQKDSEFILNNLNLSVSKGEFLSILGGNGAGKSTLLKIISGNLSPVRGKVTANLKTSLLPQNPQLLFCKKTVKEDLTEHLDKSSVNKELLQYVIDVCELGGLLDRHPFDLSGGEQQRLSLAKIILTEPDIYLLDEPTKGMDASFKRSFAATLDNLRTNGATIVMVSHDIEFCAEYSDKCALLFDGDIVVSDSPRNFFCGNSFYTTSANRLSNGIIDNAVTVNDVIYALNGKPERKKPKKDIIKPKKTEPKIQQDNKKLPLWRKILASVFGLISAVLLYLILSDNSLSTVFLNGKFTSKLFLNTFLNLSLLTTLILTALLVAKRDNFKPPMQTEKAKRRLKKRTVFSSLIYVAFIPAVLFFGVNYLDKSKYLFLSLVILFLSMLPFFIIFDGKNPTAKEIVVIAVLCSLGVAGRLAFFMLPQFKPVLALTILSGIALGAESGFLVGSLTMLISNILFSQGPLTPWQMFSMGIIGFFAGILFKKGLLRRYKISISIFGAISAIVIYGFIMNTASMITWQRSFNFKILLSYLVSGFPFDCVHALSTFLFLWIGTEPILEKLDRVKTKYGILE